MAIHRQLSHSYSKVNYLIPGINGRARCLGGNGQVYDDYASLSRAVRRHRKKTRDDTQDNGRRERDAISPSLSRSLHSDIVRVLLETSPSSDSLISLSSHIRELVAQTTFNELSGDRPDSDSDHHQLGDYHRQGGHQNHCPKHQEEDHKDQSGANSLSVDGSGREVSNIRHADLVFLTQALSHEVATMRQQYRAIVEAQGMAMLPRSASDGGGPSSSTDLTLKPDRPNTPRHRRRRTISNAESHFHAPQSPSIAKMKRRSSLLPASAHEQRRSTYAGTRNEPSLSKVESRWNDQIEPDVNFMLSGKMHDSRSKHSPKPKKTTWKSSKTKDKKSVSPGIPDNI